MGLKQFLDRRTRHVSCSGGHRGNADACNHFENLGVTVSAHSEPLDLGFRHIAALFD